LHAARDSRRRTIGLTAFWEAATVSY
jgi:hypothetical protein